MPSLDWNKAVWDGEYDWDQQGDEWSGAWGGAGMQWQFMLLPRIQAFLPAATILEIAPGFGRWTRHLKDHCQKLIAVDFAEKCIERCRERFRGVSHIEYHVNDGRSLPMVADRSVDFAFSFDSLVHVDFAVVETYIGELGRVLAPNGAAVLHHSNLGEYLPQVRDKFETEKKWHHRGTDVTAAKVEAAAVAAGLQCCGQELVNWGITPELTDGVSLFARPGSLFARPNRVVRNPEFMADAARIRRLGEVYGAFAGG